MTEGQSEDPHTESQVIAREHAVLRKHFGEAWRAWKWIRDQFTATSLGVIGAILLTAGGWVMRLNTEVSTQKTHIDLLEGRVVPVLEAGNRLTKLETAMTSLTATVTQVVANHEGRIKRVEDNLDLDYLDRVKADREAKQQARRKR